MLTDDFYPALERPDVDLVSDRIEAITPGGVRTADGRERAADVLVLATGFKSHEFVAPMEIAGAGGRTLAQEWAGVARAYLGVTVPGFPNLFLLYGPNTNGGTGSVVSTIEASIGHVLAALRELERTGASDDRGQARGRRRVRRVAARGAGRHRLALGLHELVRRRARQRPEPMAVDVARVPAPHGHAGPGRLRAELKLGAQRGLGRGGVGVGDDLERAGLDAVEPLADDVRGVVLGNVPGGGHVGVGGAQDTAR